MNAAAVLPAGRFPRVLSMQGGACGRWLALAGVALLLFFGSYRIHAGEARIRTELDSARRETLTLRVRQEVLRERIFALARRLDDLESGRSVPVSASGGGGSELSRPAPSRSTPGSGR